MSLVVLGANGVEDPTSEEAMEKGQSGKVLGVIIPPPDIRAVVDKTAQFVGRHGKEFEQKIIEKAGAGGGSSTKFNFMRSHDPYNAYYEFKIKEIEENGGMAKPKPPKPPAEETKAEEKAVGGGENGGAGAAAAGIVRKEKMSALAKAVTRAKAAGASGAVKPAPPAFSLVHPTGLSAMDVDVIKLTAQYTAVSGRNFLAGLAQREQRNPQFDFLKPTHLLFSYFTALVDAYSKVLAPPEQQRQDLERGTNPDAVLDRVVLRWSLDRDEEEKKRRAREDVDKQAALYRAVDWHDFVLVETIDFPEDELVGDAPPRAPAAVPPPPRPAVAATTWTWIWTWRTTRDRRRRRRRRRGARRTRTRTRRRR